MTEGARVKVLSEKGKNSCFLVKNEVFWSFRGQNGFKTPIVPYRETWKPAKVYSPTWTRMTEASRVEVLSEKSKTAVFGSKNCFFCHLGVKMAETDCNFF